MNIFRLFFFFFFLFRHAIAISTTIRSTELHFNKFLSKKSNILSVLCSSNFNGATRTHTFNKQVHAEPNTSEHLICTIHTLNAHTRSHSKLINCTELRTEREKERKKNTKFHLISFRLYSSFKP